MSNHLQSLLDARTNLKALPQTEDVASVLHMVENNIAIGYGRRGYKAFDGAFVAREIDRVLGLARCCDVHHLRPRSDAEAERLLAMAHQPEQLIFVFGSNQGGIHAGGAARDAKELFGAVMGIPFGLRGRSFAIPTLDIDFQQMPLDGIRSSVSLFLRFAAGRPDWLFYVTAIGTGIAGFTHEQIAPLFVNAPSNCLLPPEWAALISSTPDRKES